VTSTHQEASDVADVPTVPPTTSAVPPSTAKATNPKYAQVREAILELIEGSAAGAPIPPERALVERFGVSRVTLRRAVDDLVRDGLLVRRQGSGTYVAEPKIAQPVSTTSFTQDMRRRGMTPSSRVLSFDRRPAEARTARRLHLSPGATVVELVRLRLADDEPMALETVLLPDELVPELEADDLVSRSLYALLDERYGHRVASVQQIIEPSVTNEDESAALGVPLHSPALLLRTTASGQDGRVLESARSLFRGDRYAIVAEVQAGRNGQQDVELSGIVTPAYA
jgi:GntR family transcriptional regulator